MKLADDQFDDSMPEKMGEDLGRLFAHDGPVPATVDRVILDRIGQRAAAIRRTRALLRWGGGAAAAAAAVLVALHVHHAAPVLRPGARVTILDAFSLARQLKVGGKIDKTWDANADDVVDQRDVDALAQRAVTLGGPQ